MNDPVGASRAFYSLNGRSLPFVIDTGAPCCLIRREILAKNVKIDASERIPIRGIGGGIYTLGTTVLIISLHGLKFLCKFQVVDGLKLTSINGILGNEFMIKYGASIDFELNRQGQVTTTLRNTPSDAMLIPARSEIITYIETNVENDHVVFPKEIANDVFIASSIVRPKDGKIPVRILNTREENVHVHKLQPMMKPLYEFLLLEKTDFVTEGREELLLKSVNLNHLKGDERLSIKQICKKFADIFYYPEIN